METISVLVADAQFLVAESLAAALRNFDEFDVVEEYPTSGVKAIGTIAERKPDVAVIDYWLEGMEAWAVTTALLARLPNLKILHLSWFYGPNQIQESLASGAVGFLPKSSSVAKVAEGIRRAANGEHPVFREEMEDLAAKLQLSQTIVEQRSEGAASLTPRELAVLRLMAGGFPLGTIAERLEIREGTVRRYIENILRKLKAGTRLEAVLTAKDQGLVP